MHVQVVTLDRGMMGEQEYISFAHEVAPRIAAVPGLLAAVWLDGAETGTYGGVFFWEDHSSMERFTDSRLFADTFGLFGEVLIAHADVLENVTMQTQPTLQIVPASGPGTVSQLAPSRGEGAEAGRLTRRKAITAKKSAGSKRAPAGARATAGKATSVRELAGKPKPASRKAAPAKAKPAATTRKAAGGGKPKTRAKR